MISVVGYIYRYGGSPIDRSINRPVPFYAMPSCQIILTVQIHVQAYLQYGLAPSPTITINKKRRKIAWYIHALCKSKPPPHIRVDGIMAILAKQTRRVRAPTLQPSQRTLHHLGRRPGFRRFGG